ncbi:MAG: hypothetical protein AVDCRST_MAG16-333, partial [uncultured Frankineae bacterium]
PGPVLAAVRRQRDRVVVRPHQPASAAVEDRPHHARPVRRRGRVLGRGPACRGCAPAAHRRGARQLPPRRRLPSRHLPARPVRIRPAPRPRRSRM